ncbi:hypothetical protein [Clostridium botulinum]|uniref:hypothetical protein n=1 Tax=Clostridium botulinum TaxID=1491 RepID=UPI00064C5B90|nr:hypothetical protein [Clostridium botulinum]KLU76975.1 hypothetical protein CBC3_00865 [Clostridium botulinum V891]KOA90680.1 hypothetical protein ADU76_13010 [Clostridium botulinum]KOC33088.1 hypothetical protein ADU81_10360 [Clostridium botulinum]MCD3203928.1 hypothetical protein [Clostridium botulinum C/D]MCD3223239.1 hypothetical protein [Clostridium botulinum C/D]
MLPNEPYFIFNIDMLFTNDTIDLDALNFINENSPYSCFFFTNNCDVSHNHFYMKLINNNFLCNYKNIISPTYVLINYLKKVYGNFSAFVISNSNDLQDFKELNVPLNSKNPDFIFLNTTKISSKDLAFLQNTKSIITLSYKLCNYGTLTCDFCKNKCIIEYFKKRFSDRLVIPDRNILSSSYNIFNQLHIDTRQLVLVTNDLSEEYSTFQKYGGNLILILNKGISFNDYINSSITPDIVVDNFKTLCNFLKK